MLNDPKKIHFEDITNAILSVKKEMVIANSHLIQPSKNTELLYDQIKLFQKLILKFMSSVELNPDENHTLILTNEENKTATLIYKYTLQRTSLTGYFQLSKDGNIKKTTYRLDFSNPSLVYNKRKIKNDLSIIKDEITRFQKAVSAYVNGKAAFYVLNPD